MHHEFIVNSDSPGIVKLNTYKDKEDAYPIRTSVQSIDKNTSFYKMYRNDCMKNVDENYVDSINPQEEFKKLYLNDLMNLINTSSDKQIRYWENNLRDNMLDDIRIKDRVLVRRQVAD